MNFSPIIVVAGASGYIGKALIPRLLLYFPDCQIIALSRASQASDDPRVQWRACDLFSLKSIENAFPEKVDLAIYLVHSMGATAQLDQGSFADYDLILADNFARALKNVNLQHLIYLGGLVPEGTALSKHLESRLEVETCFFEHQLPLTVFRAGLILGEGGSSFQILLKIVNRLPIMVCPHWTQTLTTPVDIETVLKSIVDVSLKTEHIEKVYDLAGCEPLTYLDMMKQTAIKMGKKRYFLTVPFFTPTLSRLWVSLITNSSKDLVYPLVESLEHAMVARPANLLKKDMTEKKYSDLLKNTSIKIKSTSKIFKFRAVRKTVRSVQRLPLPQNKNAKWINDQYNQWLPQFLSPWINVSHEGSALMFSLFNFKWPMLDLKLSLERSDPDRQLLYITEGLLVDKLNKGRLEFRVVLNRKFVLAAIHEYRPALPWFIYKYTQAKLHLYVMNSFRKYLEKTEKC